LEIKQIQLVKQMKTHAYNSCLQTTDALDKSQLKLRCNTKDYVVFNWQCVAFKPSRRLIENIFRTHARNFQSQENITR